MPGHEREVRTLHCRRGRPGGAAGAEDDRVHGFRLRTHLFDRGPDGRDVGVVAPKTAVVVDDRVDGPGAHRIGRDRVQLIHHGLLVRDRDVGPADIRCPQLLDCSPKLLGRNIEEVVGPVHPERIEGGVVHGRASRIGDPVAQQIDLQLPLTPYCTLSRSKSCSLVSKWVVPCLSVK